MEHGLFKTVIIFENYIMGFSMKFNFFSDIIIYNKKYLLDQIKTYESLMRDLEEEPKQKESFKPKIQYQKKRIIIY